MPRRPSAGLVSAISGTRPALASASMSFSPPQSSTRMVTGSPFIASTMHAVGLGLRRLVGHRLAVHEQELGAQQADADARRTGRSAAARSAVPGWPATPPPRRPAFRRAAGAAWRSAGARGRRRRRRGGRRPGVSGEGFSTTVPAAPSTTAMSPGRMACATPAAPSTAGTPKRAQHHRGMAVGAAFLGRDARQPRRIEQAPRRPGAATRRPAPRRRAGRQSCGTARGSGCAPGGGRSRGSPRRGAAGWRGPRPTCRAPPGP